jgi:hypothetical protein
MNIEVSSHCIHSGWEGRSPDSMLETCRHLAKGHNLAAGLMERNRVLSEMIYESLYMHRLIWDSK